MKFIPLLISVLFIGCAPGDGEDTTINIATGDEAAAGDPATESEITTTNDNDNNRN